MRFIPSMHWGPILGGSDIAYIFGKGFLCGQKRNLPGEMSGQYDRKTPKRTEFRCPRNTNHMRWLVKNFTRPGKMILDPFMGSGTTLVAAKEFGRPGIGIEISRKVCDFAIERLHTVQLRDLLI